MRYYVIFERGDSTPGAWIECEFSRKYAAEAFTGDVGGRLVREDELDDDGRRLLEAWRAGGDLAMLSAVAAGIVRDSASYVKGVLETLDVGEDFSAHPGDANCALLEQVRRLANESLTLISEAIDPDGRTARAAATTADMVAMTKDLPGS